MLRLEEVTNECFHSVSLELTEGAVAKIITHSDYDAKVLLDSIVSVREPIHGQVFLFNKSIYSIPRKERMKIFKKIGVVWRNGGGISNLTVWENITLPLSYHMRTKPEEGEELVAGIFRHPGRDSAALSEIMDKYPGALPFHEKKLMGVVRAMILKPEFILYDSLFDGLNKETTEKLAAATTGFHREKLNRTSLYVSANEHSLQAITADIVFKQHGNRIYPA